ncbi:LacI family DNA-binding transcriptional regulator [Anaerotruncus colihominis]|uniref:LacI family DNA-binding transcriptional regulator n=1 Tax=Anaerotruncus colihominis TaxID=169435 RepID=UPI001899AC80|nr:LacI family DNA-binding transcriptional regulator [Anaerotruncus colihominis]
MREATIRDVAREAGVSISTVSKVLNQKGRVGTQTIEHVRKVAEKLNYTPNSIAVSMVVKKSNLIAVMVPDIITDFYAQVIQGVEEAAREIGLSTIIVNTDAKRENEYGLLYGRIGKLVDGVVAIPSVNDRQIYAAFDKPIVFVDRLVDDAGIDSIVIDNYNGAYAATRCLIGKGHRRIGFISAGLDINVGKERYLGYAQALRDFKIAENRDYVYFGDWHEATGQRAVEHFSALKQPPTALFAANCNICIGVLKYCSDHAVKIGADYSLIGFDDHLLAHYASPKVTVVSRPTIEMGHQAVAMLESRMTPQGRRESRKKIVLPVKLVERDSVSAVSDENK